MHDRQQRRRDGRLTAGEGQARRAAIQRRQALFEDVGGGVHQAGVDVAEFAQAEQIRRVLRVVEHVARRRIDRHGTGRGRGVWHLTGVECQGAQFISWFIVGHVRISLVFVLGLRKELAHQPPEIYCSEYCADRVSVPVPRLSG